MVQDLTTLLSNITDSNSVQVSVSSSSIRVRIVAKWFANMGPNERVDYVKEGIEILYPEAISRYQIEIIALTPSESN